MNAILTSNEFKCLRDYIETHCGIALNENKRYLIESRLMPLLAENGCSDFSSFYHLLKNQNDANLSEKIIDAITTNETLWFRDRHPYVILPEVLFPLFAEEIQRGRKLKIRLWSAACSTGQEPYSLALTIHEFCRLHNFLKPEHFDILATDISPSALAVAQSGRYDSLAIRRGLDEDLLSRYFRKEGSQWVLDEKVRRLVRFRKFNLQKSTAELGCFDIVFLRYVAIYFSEELKRKVFANVARSIAREGYLIMGAVESLRGYSEGFQALSHSGGIYYQYRSDGVSRLP